MGGVQVARGGEGRSVKSMGEIGKDFSLKFLLPYLENIDGASCFDGSRRLIPELIPQPSLKRFAISFGDGSHLGVPCRIGPLGRDEWVLETKSSDQYRKDP